MNEDNLKLNTKIIIICLIILFVVICIIAFLKGMESVSVTGDIELEIERHSEFIELNNSI